MSFLKSYLPVALFIASASIAGAQSAPGTAKPNAPPAASAPGAQPSQAKPPGEAAEPNVPAETPVITVNGVCDITTNGTAKTPVHTTTSAKTSAASGNSSPASSGNCKTQITRGEFDKIMKAVGAPSSARRQVANTYVQFLAAANEGIKLGVDKDPEFPEQFALVRLQFLKQLAERKLQTQAANVSDDDAKAYYDQNLAAFEEVTLTRIFVPRSANSTTPGQQPANDSEAIAKTAHDQLAAGGDPEKIQKGVYEQLKTTSEPPTTKFGSKRRGALPPAHEQKVFALKPGEVTDPIQDTVGFVVYRLDSKQQLPFDQAKDDIKRRVTQQRLQDVRQQIVASSKADYNDTYFGPETPAASPASPRGLSPGAGAVPRGPAGASPTPNSVQPAQTQPTTPKQ